MIPREFECQLNLQRFLSSCPNVRTVVDAVQELELFIFPFLAGDLLRLSQKNLSEGMRRNVLRSALRGLADMHDKNILHNGNLEHSRTAFVTVLAVNRHQAQQYSYRL